MHAVLCPSQADASRVHWLVTPQRWEQWLAHHDLLPVVAAFPNEALPAQWAAVWRTQTMSVLLETGKQGRYTVLGSTIRTRLIGSATEAGQWHREEEGSRERIVERWSGSPLAVLHAWLARRRMPEIEDAPPFYGGLIGYLTYDAVETIEALRMPERAPLAYPGYIWAEVDAGWVFDHETSTLYCFSLSSPDEISRTTGGLKAAYTHAQTRVSALHAQWSRWRTESVPSPPPVRPVTLPSDYFTAPEMELSLPRDKFMAAVSAVQERIAAGETYQVNLSIRQRRTLSAAPERVYEALRRLNPSPYMALLRFPEATVVSGSPELLVSAAGGRLETHPIAATRPRGATPEADAALAAELMANAKERAEHLMLVDLLRNDIGRVAEYGSVRVTDFMAIERYSHVMHLVSRVEGRLANGRTLCEAIASLFPGGTITGAPKVRTMEIIGELEPVRRGIYTGAIGWLGYNANLKLNIAIRTLVAMGGEAQVQSGAGIVADSRPAHEYEESLNKARALWLAVERATEEERSSRQREVPCPS